MDLQLTPSRQGFALDFDRREFLHSLDPKQSAMRLFYRSAV